MNDRLLSYRFPSFLSFCAIACAILFVAQPALAQPFSGCGEIVQVQFCTLFKADADETHYLLEDLGGFTVGDRIHVEGLIKSCFSICFVDCIFTTSVTKCPDNGKGDFAACGEIIQGVTCPLFEADSGEVLVLDNMGDFTIGDRVFVEGTFNPDCITFCLQGDGCLHDNTIDKCLECPADLTGDGNIGVADLLQLLSCWGEVEPGSECESADLTGDGSVGVADLLELLAQWGECPR